MQEFNGYKVISFEEAMKIQCRSYDADELQEEIRTRCDSFQQFMETMIIDFKANLFSFEKICVTIFFWLHFRIDIISFKRQRLVFEAMD